MKNLENLRDIRAKNYASSKLKIRISGVKINSKQNADDISDFYKEFADEISLVNYLPWESSYDNDVNNITTPCSDLFRKIFIWWDGKVNPCDYDYKSTLSKWNANDLTIKEIWNSKFYNEIREFHLNKQRSKVSPCNKCSAT